MDTKNQNEQQVKMQPTEAYPLEDHSLPADEIIAAQQSESVNNETKPIFIP